MKETAVPVVHIAGTAAKGYHGRCLRIVLRLWQQLHRLWKPQLLSPLVAALLCFPCTPT